MTEEVLEEVSVPESTTEEVPEVTLEQGWWQAVDYARDAAMPLGNANLPVNSSPLTGSCVGPISPAP